MKFSTTLPFFADAVQTLQAAFLMACLAAEHAVHTSAIRTMVEPVLFNPSSTSLTPAFIPSTIVGSSDSMEVGELGSYLGDCAHVPANPCGRAIEIGPLLANSTNQMSYVPQFD